MLIVRFYMILKIYFVPKKIKNKEYVCSSSLENMMHVCTWFYFSMLKSQIKKSTSIENFERYSQCHFHQSYTGQKWKEKRTYK